VPLLDEVTVLDEMNPGHAEHMYMEAAWIVRFGAWTS
jgi:hypothetical protein